MRNVGLSYRRKSFGAATHLFEQQYRCIGSEGGSDRAENEIR